METTEIATEMELTLSNQEAGILSSKKSPSPFINANTIEVSLQHLKRDCNIPVFSKDNESTISHQEFIQTVWESAYNMFPKETIYEPQIRVSHEIKGRIPEAVGKPAKELLPHEKTIYYERAAFVIEIPSIRDSINSNELCLTIGGVRAINEQNLNGRKTLEKFKVFIGYKNKVCTNLCISTDGLMSELKADNLLDLKSKVIFLLESYNMKKHLTEMDSFCEYELTQHQFCQFIGKSRLYQYLPKKDKVEIPNLALNDGQISAVTKSYFDDENFAANGNGSIDLWRVFNLLTGSTKSSYIDSFLERTNNAFQLTQGLAQALEGDSSYKWFLE